MDKINLLVSQLGEGRVKRDVDLIESFQTKSTGKTAAFYIATTTRELIKAVELCRELEIDYLVLGSGSKVIIAKDNFDGLIIKNRSDSLRIFGVKGKVSRDGIGVEEALLEAGSGISLAGLLKYIQEQKLGGMEILENLSGTLGGSFLTNQTLQEKAIQVKVLNLSGFQKIKLPKELLKEEIILAVVFKLKAKKV